MLKKDERKNTEKRLSIRFGATAPALSEQLKEHGIKLSLAQVIHVKNCEGLRDCANRLVIGLLIPDGVASKIYTRLLVHLAKGLKGVDK